MPELPDVTIYLEALDREVVGHRLERLHLVSPFVLRTWEPPADAFAGATLRSVSRLGKRLVLAFNDDRFAVVHLMIAGRLRWGPRRGVPRSRGTLAGWEFDHGLLLLTEAGSRHRAAIHLVQGSAGLAAHDPGGLEPLDANRAAFAAALRRENHTLKRALTDPTILSGIGNTWSDEILCAAGLSPLALTARLDDAAYDRLYDATQAVLRDGLERLRAQVGTRFPGPGEITASRPEFAVHGKYGQPCGRCGETVQRIVYAEHETHYCPRCQTAGRLLADRSLSRLLKDDWPRTVEELEARLRG